MRVAVVGAGLRRPGLRRRSRARRRRRHGLRGARPRRRPRLVGRDARRRALRARRGVHRDGLRPLLPARGGVRARAARSRLRVRRARGARGRACVAHAAARGRSRARGVGRMRSAPMRRASPPPTRSRARRSTPLARDWPCTRRLEGTYTVELERVSASWLASAEIRAEEADIRAARPHAWPTATTPSRKHSRQSSASACCSAARSHDLRNVEGGVTLGTAGVRRALRTRRAGRAPLHGSRQAPAGAPRARRAIERLAVGHGRQAARAARRGPPRPPPCSRSRRRSGPGRRADAAALPRPSPPRSPAGSRRRRRSRSLLGPRRWRAALRELRPELALAEDAVRHALVERRVLRRLVRLPPSRMVDTRRRGGRGALRPHPSRRRAHGRRILRHARGRPAQRRPRRRRGARRTCAEVRLHIDQCPICDLDWWLADGSRESPISDFSRRAQRDRKPAPRSCGGAVQARHHPRQRRRAGPARRL